ncbi:MAG: nicotinamidase/pyrazinamidase [Paraglaciecola sp.]
MSKTHRALIISCLQNDFLDWGSLGIEGSNGLVEFANQKMEEFDTIIAIQDWHPATHQSFAANHPWRKPGQTMNINGIDQKLWTMHCIQDTFGAELAVDLEDGSFAAIFQKGALSEVDSLSAFFDEKGVKSTDLDDFLKEKGITELFIMGMITEFDIRKTALDALELGYQVNVFAEGCCGFSKDSGIVIQAFEEIEKAGGKIIE